MYRNCVDCDKEFEITEGEERFYSRKNLNLPRRCSCCRQNGDIFTSLGYRSVYFPTQAGNYNYVVEKASWKYVISFTSDGKIKYCKLLESEYRNNKLYVGKFIWVDSYLEADQFTGETFALRGIKFFAKKMNKDISFFKAIHVLQRKSMV